MQVLITENGGTKRELSLENVKPEYEFLNAIVQGLKQMDNSNSIYFPHPGGGLREAVAHLDLRFIDYKRAGVIVFKDQKGELRQAYQVEITAQEPWGYHLRYRMGVKHTKHLHPSGTESHYETNEVIASFVRNFMVGASFRKVIST